MLYLEEIDTRLCICLEKMPLNFPCAATKQSPHPTNETPNLSHVLVLRLTKALKVSILTRVSATLHHHHNIMLTSVMGP